MIKESVKAFIRYIIEEDLGDGDHTSLACIPAEAMGKAVLLVKEDGVLAGVEVAKEVFYQVDPKLQMEVLLEDGAKVRVGEKAFYVTGPVRSILQAERLVLNLMQRMSGIATKTHHIAQMIEGTNARLLDTRKTTPGLRYFEKLAVRIGGGYNHRIGLFDMIMIKDNHIDYAGGVGAAIERVRQYLKDTGRSLQIEVEARNMKEVQEILDHGSVDRIMLDNFSPDQIREALAVIGNRAETEASGGITEATIRSYAETGVNYISMGALTHSVKSLDLSLKAVD